MQLSLLHKMQMSYVTAIVIETFIRIIEFIINTFSAVLILHTSIIY
jgi:hypothetical protein